MITLKQFMEAVDYRITEGSRYEWQCFGFNAYRLDSWNGDHDGHSISITFDTLTQEVYEANIYDYTRERAYRMINPKFKSAHDTECKDRDVTDSAWEQDDGTPLNYIDLDVDEDFLEKAKAVVSGKDYDTRVQLQVTFSDEDLLTYMKIAHDRDITFNELVEIALEEAIDQYRMLNDEPREEYDFTNAVRGLPSESVKKLKKKKAKK